MTKEEFIAMAREAGFMLRSESVDGESDWWECFDEEIESFARLVRNDYSNKHAQLWLTRIEDSVKAEREEIALEFEKRHESVGHLNNYWLHAANHVRERGRV